MKSKLLLLSLISFLFTFAAVAQEVESDDMYFNSKDRAKLNAAKATQASLTASIKKAKREAPVEQQEEANPTDSYSARNVNPEYEARTNAASAQADNEDYFVSNYRYRNANEINTWNNNFNSRYNNPWYSANYWGPSINSWNTPYYGSYYDSWGSPWANPYYQSGWSSSFSYHWGNSWDYGWGMNYGFGYGNPYYNPYYSYSPYASYGLGFGYSRWNSYYGGYGYPTQVVIIENGARNSAVYGKRASRSSQMSREYNNGSTRSNNRGIVDSGNGRPATGGRTSTVTTTAPSRQSDYYNRGWRNQSSQYGTTNTNTTNTNTRSSWENSSRSSWRESSGGSTYTPSPSGSSGSGGGSSSGSSGGGSSSGSRSGGRGN
jgi:hypothetical protein